MFAFLTPELGRKILLGASAVLALAGLLIYIWPDSTLVAQRKRLEQDGLVTTGTVKGKFIKEYVSYETQHNSQLPGRPAGVIQSYNAGARAARILNGEARPEDGAKINYTHYINVEFKAQTGQTVTAALEIHPSFYSGIQNGAAVSVLYHPANPAGVARAKTMSTPFIDISGIMIIPALFLLTIAFVLLIYAKPWRPFSSGVRESAELQVASAAESRLQRVTANPRQRVAAAAHTAVDVPRRVSAGPPGRAVRRFGQASR